MTLLNAILQNDTIKVIVLDSPKTVIDYLKEPNTVIAILAILLSVFSLFYSVYYNSKTLKHTIRHNKLSVEPALKNFRYIDSKTKTIKIEIVNCGLGTAIINEISLIYKDVTYTRNDFKELLERNNILSKSIIRLYSYTDISPIASNERIRLFYSDIEEDENYYKINDIFSETIISVDYMTLYNEKKNHKDFL
jgi:hypothetical protein